MNDQHISLAEAISTPRNQDPAQKTWVNGSFIATVTNLQTRQSKVGKTFWTATLVDTDTGAEADIAFFTNPAKFSGQLCRFGGNGISIDDYNGRAKIGIGKTTIITILSGAQNQGMASQQPPYQQPQQQARWVQPTAGIPPQAPQRPLAAPQGGNKPVLGVTVGMALNNAVNAMESVAGSPTPGTTEWAREVYQIASDLIRIAHSLERGNLAPLVSTREGGVAPVEPMPAQQPPPYQPPSDSHPDLEPSRPPASSGRMPAPGPGGSVAFDNVDEDDSCPF